MSPLINIENEIYANVTKHLSYLKQKVPFPRFKVVSKMS